MTTIDIIVLAGGMGTRLKSVIDDIPKPMAPIGNIPFLTYLLRSMNAPFINKIIFSTGYRSEVIEQYFKEEFDGLHLEYAREEEPLGTGGAIKMALSHTETETVMVLNGDTMFNINYEALLSFHRNRGADISIAMRKVENESRYGAMYIDEDGRVTEFAEKAYIDSGYINGGIYLINKDLFTTLTLPEKFSLEHDLFAKHLVDLEIYGLPFDSSYFIDIGIPEDYERACKELPELF